MCKEGGKYSHPSSQSGTYLIFAPPYLKPLPHLTIIPHSPAPRISGLHTTLLSGTHSTVELS